jgi:hypothetical protein
MLKKGLGGSGRRCLYWLRISDNRVDKQCHDRWYESGLHEAQFPVRIFGLGNEAEIDEIIEAHW